MQQVFSPSLSCQSINFVQLKFYAVLISMNLANEKQSNDTIYYDSKRRKKKEERKGFHCLRH